MDKNFTGILETAKALFNISIKKNGIYVDFTMGNGNDTLYIKKMCPNSKIYAFDIQKEAIEITRKKLEDENCFDNNIKLIHDTHENFRNHINNNIDGAMFNLGYLPGGSKNITTKTISTLSCLDNALNYLNKNGVIVVVIYVGHEEGALESNAIYEFSKKIDSTQFACLIYRFINIENAPYIIAFQKK